MEVIEESLRVSNRTHLFNWLQRGVQYLIGHEVMIFGVRSSGNHFYDFEYFTSSRYFGEDQFTAMINNNQGLLKAASAAWLKSSLPVFVTHKVPATECNHYSVVHYSEAELFTSELKTFVMHGFGDSRAKVSTIVVFGRLSSEINVQTAHLLELIMPHLHCAIIRVASSRSGNINNVNEMHKKVTKREQEVLQWLQMGKTNWEISLILDVSPLTIKNHVQNIIRKLDVENRGQAVLKAVKLGIVSSHNHN
ncbi:MAG TPA: XrtB/PEP-CTERM-associated transcriptional regulator EpsA [Methylophilus sp.]